MTEHAIEVQSVTVTVAGEPIVVQPLKVGQIPAFAKAAQRIIPKMSKLESAEGIVDLLAENGYELISAVIVATGLSAEKVQSLELDDFVVLATAVIEVNADFFTKRLAPTVQSSISTMTKALSGSTPSRSS